MSDKSLLDLVMENGPSDCRASNEYCDMQRRIAELESQLTAANARVEALNANAIVRRIGDIDYENGDSLCLKFGGDGDNGEYLIELMEQAIEALLEQEKGE